MLCVYKQYFSLIAIFIADSEMKIDEFFSSPPHHASDNVSRGACTADTNRHKSEL